MEETNCLEIYELQQWDWVYIQEKGSEEKYKKQIDLIHDVNCNFSPIPITKDILLSMGFEKNDYSCRDYLDLHGPAPKESIKKLFIYDLEELRDYVTYIIEYTPEDNVLYITLNDDCNDFLDLKVRIFNVHELQQALRVCGLSKVANSLKFNINEVV